MRAFWLIFFCCSVTKQYFIHFCEDKASGLEEVKKFCPVPLEVLGDVYPASSMDWMKICDICGGSDGWFLPNEYAKDWVNGLISGERTLDEMYKSGSNPHVKGMTNATSQQWQIITGSLMGAGYIQKVGKGYCFGMTESKDKDWLGYKVAELCGLGNSTFFEDSGRLRWRTRVNAISFDLFCQNHYNKRQKTIRPIVLEQIMDTGLMVWYMDKGFWRTPKTIAFRTSYIDDKGNMAIVKFLNSVDINAKFKKYERSKQIVLDKDGTETFLATISGRVPHFMEYRLEP
jgi:hypothetical protein